MSKCLCGCGEEVVQKYKYHVSKYILGHNRRNKKAWNSGLTKENNTLLNDISKKISKSKKGKETWSKGKNIWENKEHPRGMKGRKHSKETLYLFSKERKGKNTGELSLHWKGGSTNYWAKEYKKIIKECELCKGVENLNVHHKDKNRKNNSRYKSIVLCIVCHQFWHYSK